MKGHENLIKMRLAGKKPSAIWVYLRDYPNWNFNWEFACPDKPEVFISPKDNLRLLDLRFAVGLTVHIIGNDEARTRDVLNALQAANAKRVIAVLGAEIIDTGARHAHPIA
jgi:hypothetical protein